MLEAKCNLCQKEFSLENIKKGHFTKEWKGCGTIEETNYYHPECLKEQEREKTNNPLLFAKMKKLEEELEQLKRIVKTSNL
jgi:hypothetical protein